MDTRRLRPTAQEDTSTIAHVAVHEAAHATLDLLFEIPVHSVEIREHMTGFTDGRGATWFNDRNNPLPAWRRAARLAFANAAGFAVEIEYPGVDSEHAKHAAGFTQRPPVGDAEQLYASLGRMELEESSGWTLRPEAEIELVATVLTKAADLVLNQCSPVHKEIALGLMTRGLVQKDELDALRNHECLIAARATLEDGKVEEAFRDKLRTIVAAGIAPPAPSPVPKQGRNELCACGSGKKFKKCHGA